MIHEINSPMALSIYTSGAKNVDIYQNSKINVGNISWRLFIYETMCFLLDS